MQHEQATRLITETLTNGFDETRFHRFASELLNHLDDSAARRGSWAGAYIKKAYQERVRHYKRLGTYTDPQGDKLDVLVIHLAQPEALERARTMLRNFVADYLTNGHGADKDAVLAAYVAPNGQDWRFSFVRLEYKPVRDAATGKVKDTIELTPARRYSFLVGPHERSHTAQAQFLPLLENVQSDPLLSALEEAFQIERVTKEFFARYQELFVKTCAALNQLRETQPAIAQEFARLAGYADDAVAPNEAAEASAESVANFAKKLLGQIVFLYFLQKKGWFGVEKDAAWGSGDRHFLRYLFTHRAQLGTRQERAGQRPVNFFNDILEHLFYDALNTERDGHFYPRFDCRIPFLNGGLFEPLTGYRWQTLELLLPDELFANQERTSAGDLGTGILDVFDRYNFTVNEAEPLETEVAVDPEMLGKVFENLLPENLRHKGGTYYTPRVIVHYMCQQSLINYLATHLPDVPRADLETLIVRGEVWREFEANQRQNETHTLPEVIRQRARELDKLLADITVCDPAIGSGAFPVGMMQEIVRARCTLGSLRDAAGRPVVTPRLPYELKRHAIEKSLYGVDWDAGAIEIARLRLWLSLVVDEDDFQNIKPLPNLDYKIMQGNSLLEEFAGVKLWDESLLKPVFDDTAAQSETLQQRIYELQRRYFELDRKDLDRQGLRTKEAKRQIGKQIDGLQKQMRSLRAPVGAETGQGTFDALQGAAQQKLAEIKRLQGEFFHESRPRKKRDLRERLAQLEWAFMEDTLRERNATAALTELRQHRRDQRKNFFLWQFHFLEVFQQRGGFDVVIGNPPYVRQEAIKHLKAALQRNYAAYTGTADLYVYFYECGLKLLRERGTLAFITSNKYFRAGYGAKLREMLAGQTRIGQIIDFGDAPVFEATAYASIIIVRREVAPDHKMRVWSLPQKAEINSFERQFAAQGLILPQAELKPDGWRLESPQVLRLLEKLRAAGTPLGEYVQGKILMGIKTGLNEAFIVDRATKDRLLDADLRSREILKPFLLGRDVKRWRVNYADRYLIKIESSENKKHPWTDKPDAEAVLPPPIPQFTRICNSFALVSLNVLTKVSIFGNYVPASIGKSSSNRK